MLESHKPMHGKHGKCIFVPQGEHSRMRTSKLEFNGAERLSDDNRTQKFSNYVHILKIRSNNKVALAVELGIVNIPYLT